MKLQSLREQTTYMWYVSHGDRIVHFGRYTSDDQIFFRNLNEKFANSFCDLIAIIA